MALWPGAALAAIAGWLLTYLLHSTVLLAGAWLLTRYAPLSPAARCSLWRLAAVAGLVTATLASARSPLWPAGPHEVELHREARVEVTAMPGPSTDRVEGRVAPGGSASWVDGLATSDERPARVAFVRAVGVAGGMPSPICRAAIRDGGGPDSAWQGRVEDACGGGVRWIGWLLALWWAGALFGVVRFGLDRAARRRLVATLRPADARLRAVAMSVGGPRSAVATSESVGAPCVFPGGVVAVPEGCADALPGAELRAVLAHELGHVARRDPGWQESLAALRAVCWLQPLNRVAAREAARAAEEAADDWAVDRTGERAGLARGIERITTWAVESTPVPLTPAAGDGHVAARVRRIVTGRRRRESRMAAVIASLLLFAPLPFLPSASPTWVTARVWVGPVDGVVAAGPASEPAPGQRRWLEWRDADVDRALHIEVVRRMD